ncbi:hypothetical protein XENTR_v10017637 [Xenopus tropicalis]|nr:hypothetical protein XENTR_v10017637 [Xenopus tropicalis]
MFLIKHNLTSVDLNSILIKGPIYIPLKEENICIIGLCDLYKQNCWCYERLRPSKIIPGLSAPPGNLIFSFYSKK